MKLVHYSKIPGLKEIHPDHMGTGTRSEENKQGVPEIKRSFWYQHGTAPEDLVTQGAKSVYTTTLHPHIQLYDLAKDPQGLMPKLREEANKRTVNPGVVTGEDYIKAIKDAGFHGYHNSEAGNMSNVVALFHPQAVHHEEHVTPEHFQAFGKSEQRQVSKHDLSSPHFIFTTENPVYPASIQMTLPEAVNSLREQGEDVVEMQGQYGKPERSLLVRNPKNLPALMNLAQQTGQESAIESNGVHHKLHYLNGPSAGQYKRGTGTQWYTSAPKDNYSSISTEHGVRHFRHDFDDGLFQKAENRLNNLRKAVDAKTWKHMSEVHKKGVADSSPDHEAQFREFPHPKDYVKKVLDSKETVKPINGYSGSAQKMIHKVKVPKGEKLFMAKPYHAQSSIHNMNTTGWSTLATNALFRAGGVPDLAEKVTGYVHNGVPLTVHEFDNDKQGLYDLDSNGISNIKAHGPDVLKIAAIDFLTHNKDRHGSNIIASMPEDDGLSKIKAIDHELNFKYDGAMTHYHPREFADAIGFNMINGGKKPHSNTIKDWWNKHSDQILNTFNQHLQHLKDPEMRDYFKENFEARHKFLTDHLNDPNNRDSIFSREHEAKTKGVPSRNYWHFLSEREKK